MSKNDGDRPHHTKAKLAGMVYGMMDKRGLSPTTPVQAWPV